MNPTSVNRFTICDYCSAGGRLYIIKMTRRPNDSEVVAELCPVCLEDIYKFAKNGLKEAKEK